MPGIREMQIVGWNHALVEAWDSQWIELQIGSLARVHYLRLVHDAEYFVEQNGKVRLSARSRTVRKFVRGGVEVCVPHLINN